MPWSPPRRSVRTLFASVCALASPATALAAERPALALDYHAPAECPSRATLEEQVRARVPTGWLAGADTRRFDVTIERTSGSELVGRLQVHRPTRELHVREVQGTSCDAIVKAIAVFLAIALDPASDEPPASSPSAPPKSASRLRPPSTGAPRAPSSVTRAPPHASPAPRWIWSSGAHASLRGMPNAGWGARIHAEVTRARPKSSVGASARLSWGWSDFAVSSAGGGETSFRLQVARLEGCARIALVPQVTLAPCAAFELGTLAGTAPEVTRTIYTTTRWSAPGGSLRAAYSPLAWLSVELEGGLFVPLARSTFVLLDPYRFVFRPPWIVLDAGAGVSLNARFL